MARRRRSLITRPAAPAAPTHVGASPPEAQPAAPPTEPSPEPAPPPPPSGPGRPTPVYTARERMLTRGRRRRPSRPARDPDRLLLVAVVFLGSGALSWLVVGGVGLLILRHEVLRVLGL